MKKESTPAAIVLLAVCAAALNCGMWTVGIGELLILFMFVVFPMLALIFILKAFSRGNRHSAPDEETARAVQELYTLLERMEERIENVETILIDRGRMGDKQ